MTTKVITRARCSKCGKEEDKEVLSGKAGWLIEGWAGIRIEIIKTNNKKLYDFDICPQCLEEILIWAGIEKVE